MYKYTALPTWLVVQAVIHSDSLPTEHAFYRKKITLEKWAAGRTELCKLFDFLLVFSCAMMLVGLAII